MNADQLLNAIGSIDDRYMLAYAKEAAAPAKTSVKPFVRWAAAVCAATVAVAAAFVILPTIKQHSNNAIVSDGVPTESTTPFAGVPVTPTTDTQEGLQNDVGTTTSSDAITDEPTQPSGDRILLNSVGDFLSSGARLVNPIEVSENDFYAEYPLNLTAYLDDTAYEVTYLLQYHLLDLNTGTTDFSHLSNGWISISRDNQVLFSVYVATDRYVSDLDYTQTTETNNSVIGGCDVLLFEGLLRGQTPCLYGKFRLNGLYVTVDTTRGTQEETVALIQSLVQNTH
ncbi:MAG: hypothetical protein IJB36_02135 [Clostridia bacterium]|nr:hypothetical protein [Clostridia bacterium]